MPITNNIIKIDNAAIRPAPKFNITYETFKSGEYIIGGILKVNISGEIYGSSDTDLINKISSISSYSGTCRVLYIECNGSILINGTCFIKTISINPTDQPFIVNYTMDVEVSDSESALAIQRDQAFTDLYGLTIPDDVIIKSYEESLSVASDDSLSNTAFYVDGTYTQASLKLNGQISTQAYHHMCDNFGSPDLTNKIYDIVNARISKILSLDTSLSDAYPSLESYFNGSYTAINDNKTLNINKFDNKVDIKFDVYLIAGDCNPQAIVELSVNESTDQKTGMSTWSVQGSIKGLADGSSNSLDNNVINNTRLNNARSAYANLENKRDSADYAQFVVIGCLPAASLPSNTCYQRISSQITENFNGGQIDFNLGYGDAETCQIGGTTIDISIQEDYPTHKHVEHIIPGRGTALVQIGSNLTPFRATITASGKLNSCDTTLLSNLESCVRNKFLSTISDKGYNNYILAKETITTGKYVFKISRSYIECV